MKSILLVAVILIITGNIGVISQTIPKQAKIDSADNTFKIIDAGPLMIGRVFSGNFGKPQIIYYPKDGRIEIEGDTLTAVKVLINLIDSAGKREVDVWTKLNKYIIALEASVQFTNSVPDYWKKGTRWEAYLKELKKHGYSLRNKK